MKKGIINKFEVVLKFSALYSPIFNLTNITTASDYQIQLSIAVYMEANYDGMFQIPFCSKLTFLKKKVAIIPFQSEVRWKSLLIVTKIK